MCLRLWQFRFEALEQLSSMHTVYIVKWLWLVAFAPIRLHDVCGPPEIEAADPSSAVCMHASILSSCLCTVEACMAAYMHALYLASMHVGSPMT